MAVSASGATATVYLSPSGSDSAACTQAAPCKSFSRGYNVAAAGAEVELAGGSYGGQSFSNLAVKSSSDKVVFRPAAGATVTTSSLGFSNSQNIEVRDVKTGGWQFQNGAAHITLRRIVAGDVTYTAGYFSGSSDIQVIDSEIARVDPNDGIHMNNGGGSNTDIVIDGMFMHDLSINNDPASHDDCIQTGDVTNLTIRNSTFMNCGTQGVFLNPYNGGATKNILIENNFFGVAQLGYNVLYVGDAVGVTIRNNSFTGAVYSYNPASFTHMKMYNNIFAGTDSYNCGVLAQRSETFSNNASTTSCSGATSHLVNASLNAQFVNSGNNSATFDLHLKPGAAAIDKGTSASFAATDRDGDARPSGNAVDIGADETGGGTPPPADTTAPDTTISSGTSGSTTATTASFSFTGSDNVTASGALTFACSIDGGSYAPCTSPKSYSGLAVGDHTFAVRASDGAANVDGSPATGSWTVTAPPADTTAPTTTIGAAPPTSTAATTASFSFSGADDTTTSGALTFACSLDGAVFSACSSPKAYSGLSVGDHSFAVRATDAAGNPDASPATVTWTITAPAPVDTSAPETMISSAPSGSTTATTASIAFSGSDNVTSPGALTFECKLDGGAYAACTSPKAYSALAVGSHTVSVRATDAAGNVDASPATATWTQTSTPPADTTAPTTTISSAPQDGTTDTTASFAFTGADDTTAARSLTFQCSLDHATYATCSSPKEYAGLVPGAHNVRIRARDAAGNVDGSAASHSWSIAAPDTVAPTTTITSGPAALSLSAEAAFAFVGSDDRTADAALAFQCALDDAAWSACTSPASYTNLALLGHRFAVRAIDAAGNADATPATAAWTVLGLPEVEFPDVPSTPDTPDTPDVPDAPAPTPPAASHVALSAPTAGATFGRSLTMAASASPATGATIRRVEFWVDGSRVAKDASAPYRATWNVPSRLSTGRHTLSTRALDSKGTVVSAAVTVVHTDGSRASRSAVSKLVGAEASVVQLSSEPAGDGGTDLTGAARSTGAVTATLAPCTGTKATKSTKVKLHAVSSLLSGHQRDGRLCVVGLAPAAS